MNERTDREDMGTTGQAEGDRRPRWLLRWLLVLVATAGALWYLLLRPALYSERDWRAPVVFDVAAQDCALSLSGRYLFVQLPDRTPGAFFDVETGAEVPITIPTGFAMSTMDRWLEGDILLFADDPAAPEGWLVDVAHGVVSDTRALDAQARATLQAQAAASARRVEDWRRHSLVAPDGRHVLSLTGRGPRILDEAGTVVNEISDAEGYLDLCQFGWRADSSGYYMIDKPRKLMGVEPAGPVRLLLTTPPER